MRGYSVFFLLSIFCLGTSRADVVTETFTYPTQTDLAGFGGVFRITSTGLYGGSNPLIATFDDAFQSGAGIVDESGNTVAFFDTSQQLGIGVGQHFVGIADIPGFADSPPGGPFGSFFSSPQNLTNASGSVDVRQSSGSNATFFRMIAGDSSGNEVATNMFSLGGIFQTYNFAAADFVNQISGSGFFEDQVTEIGIEFFANADGSGDLDALQFRADNLILITIPEPSIFAGVLIVIALGLSNLPRHRRSLKPDLGRVRF